MGQNKTSLSMLAAFVSGCTAAFGQVLVQPEMLTQQVPGGGFGINVVALTDQTGDGIDDFAVLTFGGNIVHIFSGASRALIRAIPRPHAFATGFGESMTGLQDIDGDGLGDIAIGAYVEQNFGRLYVYSGATGELLYDLWPPNPVFSCRFTAILDGGPDWDGDGRGDMIVGAEGLGCRFVNIYSGATGALLHTLPDPVSQTRWTVARSMDDITGDGLADIVVHSTHSELGPRTYFFSGATANSLDRHIASPGAPVPLGDLDGDAVGDLLLVAGTSAAPELPTWSGVAFVHSGLSGDLLYTLLPPQPIAFRQFGHRGTALPDIDGDRRADFAITALNDNLPGYPAQAGVVYVYSGGTGQILRALASPDPVQPPSSAGRFGAHGLATLRGPSPNRHATLLVSAYLEEQGAGRVWLFPFCRADANADGLIDSRDISRFITGWVMTVNTPPGTLPPPGVFHGDYNDDGQVTSADISAFITDWLAAITTGC